MLIHGLESGVGVADGVQAEAADEGGQEERHGHDAIQLG